MRRAALAIAVVALAAAVAGASAAPRTASPCQGSQLRGNVHGSDGAAGTIAYSLAFRNVSHTTCLLRGYPSLKLVGAPTRTQHGGLAVLVHPATPVALAPGRYASLLLAYSDVPTGAETSCPTTHRLLVTPPGSRSAVTVTVTIMACNRGLLRESPFLAGLRPAP